MALAIPAQIFSPRPETPYHLTVRGLTSQVAATGGLTVPSTAGSIRSARRRHGYGARARSESPAPARGSCSTPWPKRVTGGGGSCRSATARSLSPRPACWTGSTPPRTGRTSTNSNESYPLFTWTGTRFTSMRGITSGGVCCGIDLCLHIVRSDVGAAAANQIARRLVAPPHRDGGQAQYVPALVPGAGDTSLAGTRAWAWNVSNSCFRSPSLPATPACPSAPSCAGSPPRRVPPLCNG